MLQKGAEPNSPCCPGERDRLAVIEGSSIPRVLITIWAETVAVRYRQITTHRLGWVAGRRRGGKGAHLLFLNENTRPEYVGVRKWKQDDCKVHSK